MGKKPTVSVTYENERISIKNSFEPLSMASDGNGCRDLRPLIRSRSVQRSLEAR